ncbi:hypothetical protein RUM43_000317 [Polyplax serrata]|uniref:Peptidase M12B domain-containing protein n=1 Tax=Polyplax serrata TaxID=468196 RepID=A0AAN8XS32_POLSC
MTVLAPKPHLAPISVIKVGHLGKYTGVIADYEIVVPQLVNKDGNFISHVVSHQHSKRSANELESIFYKIPIAGKEYLVELTLNKKLISPGAIVETHKLETRSDESSLNYKNSSQEAGKLFKNLSVRKLRNTECHFSGHVKGENISKAALSTCYGLAGFIQIEKGFYTIEPVAEHDPFVEDAFPHILYRSDRTENGSVCQAIDELAAMMSEQVMRKRRDNNFAPSSPMYIETLIVMDKSLIGYHKGSDCENYVLTVFNMAFNLFHDASLGLLMTLTIVRIIRLEVEDADMNLQVNTDAIKTLKYFQTWQYEINPGDDSHPNHHDVAIFITRVDVCYSPSSCGLLGLSTIGKACDAKESAVLCEDSGLRLGFVIAHEIGHLLGASHDEVSSNGTSVSAATTVMHPQVSLNSQLWSSSSQSYIKAFLRSGMGNCLLDEPEDHNFNTQDLLPGVMYDANFQCKHLIVSNARECDRGSSCDSLNCYVPGYACILTHSPPADGTRCGEDMWCHEGKCIGLGQRPGAVDGNWGEWSSWSECTRTCGSGVSSSVRQCDKPMPSHGGKNCVGERKRYKICATTPCKTGRPSFRDVQCGEFNDWIYPEDGKVHTWKAFYMHEDNPCTLFCINEDKKVAALRARVVDGTMCYRGIRDVCIGGSCKTLPCDLQFDSNAVEDVCGICHGDGTGCEFSGETLNITKSMKAMTKLIDVSTGSKNIKVEELSATSANIIVKDKETKDIYIKGQMLGMFTVPGSQAWLGMVKNHQQALNIPGPVTKPLSIWIQNDNNVTVKWSMALPPMQQRKPEFAWDFITWGPCSAKCGPGTQKSEPSCMEEKSGHVENMFCADLEMPPVKIRQCEIAKCEPRWMVGDWKGCEKPNTSEKIRRRVVYCIKPLGEGEGESQIVSNSECVSPKPHDTEPCENRQKREDTEYTRPFFDDTMFRSDTVEFGFHKKYDDYLTHFAALSGPQRKSETIPLHLLSSPHFKHYFRVLESPEDNLSGVNSNSGVNLSYATSDRQAQSKISPDFYKNTFSGNPIDVGHVEAQRISIKSRKRAPSELSNLFDGIHDIRSHKYLKLLRLFEKKPTNQGSLTKHGALRNLKRSNVMKKITRKKLENINKNGVRTARQGDASKREQTIRRPKVYKISKKSSVLFGDPKISSKKIRNSLHAFLSKRQNKIFNYTSPNLTNVVNNLENVDALAKTRFMNMIKGVEENVETAFPKDSESKCPWSPSNTEPVKENCQEYTSESAAQNEEFYGNEMKNIKLLRKNYDGSGMKKLNVTQCNTTSAVSSPKNTVENVDWPKKLLPGRKNSFSNPFNPMETNARIYSTKAKFKGGYKTIEDLFFEKKNKKLQTKSLKKRNAHLILWNRRGSDLVSVHPCGIRSTEDCTQRKIRKRLSRKWKRPKIKDLNGKSSAKEFGGTGYGAETRNYLNNIFRDTHVKGTPKPEFKTETEATIIDTGRLVVDRDSLDEQELDIVVQDNHGEEGSFSYQVLPQPSENSEIHLRGQEVWDLYRKLKQRDERTPRSEVLGESKAEAEINGGIANHLPKSELCNRARESNDEFEPIVTDAPSTEKVETNSFVIESSTRMPSAHRVSTTETAVESTYTPEKEEETTLPAETTTQETEDDEDEDENEDEDEDEEEGEDENENDDEEDLTSTVPTTTTVSKIKKKKEVKLKIPIKNPGDAAAKQKRFSIK